MDNSTQNTQMPPMQNQAPINSGDTKPHGQGALIGSIIIIAIIIIGAFYVIKNTQPPQKNIQEEMGVTQNDAVVDTETYLESQSSVSASDELSDIGSDIDATDINSVDYGVDAALQ